MRDDVGNFIIFWRLRTGSAHQIRVTDGVQEKGISCALQKLYGHD